ncbi:3,4-dihydroxyphenylacetaldehyde synthase 2-like [Zerene cesonia]|uniref:3,4-dihydroxyphenylacetaldehyde synthase 2-like n=1 Tax=Zerene cesonia TaxID=33412 RepID=UPI0018E5A223|nr:3,4-dihydroxyphenylacetaldehyde synthase 2-like [Zerene cesonia]
MDSQQFREFGKAAIDYIADYYDNVKTQRVLPSVQPGFLISQLPENAPEGPENWREVFQDFRELIAPGATQWHSPQFHGYYPCGTSFASIIGSLLTNGLGNVGLTWVASPACTELEVVTMNWLGKLLGLPEEFLNCSRGPGGGVILGSATEAMFVCMLAAKSKMFHSLRKLDDNLDEHQTKTKFVAYTSNQSNAAVEKCGILGSMKMRLLKSDSNGRLRGDTLRCAFEEDKANGLVPCFVVATLGTTGICAFDPLYELGPICKEYNVWMHVDAAYAGAGFICPENRYLMQGMEYADSFDVNVHKWLLVNLDCSALWVRNGYDLIRTFDVQRVYLDDVNMDLRIPDYRHWQMPLGRQFRSLKLWTVMKIYGAEGLRKHIRSQINYAKYLAKLVRSDERFVVDPEPSMGLVCIRLVEGDKMTKKLLNNLVESRQTFMVGAYHRNRLVIRVAICSQLTTKTDVENSWAIIRNEASKLIMSDISDKY